MVQGRTLPSLKENERFFFFFKKLSESEVFFFLFIPQIWALSITQLLFSLIPLLNYVYNYSDRNWFLAISLGRLSWHLQFWFLLASETQNVPYEPYVLVISSYIFYFGNFPTINIILVHSIDDSMLIVIDEPEMASVVKDLVTCCTLEDARWTCQGLWACCIGKVLMVQLSGAY